MEVSLYVFEDTILIQASIAAGKTFSLRTDSYRSLKFRPGVQIKWMRTLVQNGGSTDIIVQLPEKESEHIRALYTLGETCYQEINILLMESLFSDVSERSFRFPDWSLFRDDYEAWAEREEERGAKPIRSERELVEMMSWLGLEYSFRDSDTLCMSRESQSLLREWAYFTEEYPVTIETRQIVSNRESLVSILDSRENSSYSLGTQGHDILWIDRDQWSLFSRVWAISSEYHLEVCNPNTGEALLNRHVQGN